MIAIVRARNDRRRRDSDTCAETSEPGVAVAFPPEAFLIGAQKAGTTYLARLLDAQPGVTLASPKEPDFFARYWERGLAWYRERFGGPESSVFLDASTSYSAAPLHMDTPDTQDRSRSRFAGVPGRIHQVAPEARFIYVLREPVDRIWSAYWHDVRNAGEERPLDRALEAHPMYLNASDYLGQIRQYEPFFPIDRFLFLRFEDVRSRPERTVERCLDFLGVETRAQVVAEGTGRHQGYRMGRVGRFVKQVGRAVPGAQRLQRRVWSSMPTGMQDRIRSRLTKPIPAMDDALRARLEAHFRPMLGPLQEVTGLELEHWCRASMSPSEDADASVRIAGSGQQAGGRGS
jgi:hypothetical protein